MFITLKKIHGLFQFNQNKTDLLSYIMIRQIQAA